VPSIADTALRALATAASGEKRSLSVIAQALVRPALFVTRAVAPEIGLYVDLGEDAEALGLQRRAHFLDRLVEGGVGESPLESIAQRSHVLVLLSL
jgi:hypothetical protein